MGVGRVYKEAQQQHLQQRRVACGWGLAELLSQKDSYVFTEILMCECARMYLGPEVLRVRPHFTMRVCTAVQIASMCLLLCGSCMHTQGARVFSSAEEALASVGLTMNDLKADTATADPSVYAHRCSYCRFPPFGTHRGLSWCAWYPVAQQPGWPGKWVPPATASGAVETRPAVFAVPAVLSRPWYGLEERSASLPFPI